MQYPSVKTLVDNHAASRVHAKDATLYDFSDEARDYSANFMGWADLASNPPVPIDEIAALADRFAAEGIEHAVLIGQGGSTQASMTMSKFLKCESPRMSFRTLDSDSPIRLREMLAACDPKKTLVIVSSKSGGTLEMRTMLSAVREAFLKTLSEEELAKHLVAITDPGSALEARAAEEGWAATLPGEPTVGGRFSALSVFGLLPAALIGVDLKALFARAVEAERRCSQDSPDNPAIELAAFMYDNYTAGRAKFAFVTRKRARALGLWTEQLIAESTGKGGEGILPYLEVDTFLLAKDAGDRTVITYAVADADADGMRNFEQSLDVIDPATPRLDYRIATIEDVAEHFIMWEYATALCGYLMQVSPFDQPDVASAKERVLEILDAGLPAPNFTCEFAGDVKLGTAKVNASDNLGDVSDVESALKALVASIKPGDFFALNAFLPFTGEGRREALEAVRFAVADRLGVVSCLEIGPRFLHSTGQLQKGGPNTGVFLVISAEEDDDVALVDQPAESLGKLAEAQATGDALTLIERGRRCVHIHLPNNSSTTLRLLASLTRNALAEL